MYAVTTFINNAISGILGIIPTVLLAIVIFIAGLIVNKIIMDIFAKGVQKSKMDQTVHKFLASVIKIVITALTLIIVLSVLGIPMTSIITVLGTAGVAVGLALKDSLSNVAGGVILLINRTIKVGDYVEVGGDEGVVDEIAILFTKIVTVDNKDIYIPNGIVATSPITNYTSEGKRRVDHIIGVSYDCNHKDAITAIENVIKSNDLVLKDEDVFVRVCEFGPNSINITVRAWAATENYWNVYFDLLEQIKDAFDAKGIVMRCNKLDVRVMENK